MNDPRARDEIAGEEVTNEKRGGMSVVPIYLALLRTRALKCELLAVDDVTDTINSIS